MNRHLQHRGLWSLDELSASQAHTLLAAARALKHGSGRDQPLRGKHLAVLSEAPNSHSTDAFTRAAQSLGAQVTRIRPSLSRLAGPDEVRTTARLLDRLYDAVQCDDIDDDVMRELAAAAAIPVYNAVAGDQHPTRMLADLMSMQEAVAQRGNGVALCLLGGERSAWCAAWRQLGQVIGPAIRVQPASPPAGAGVHGVDFVCDLLGKRCVDGHPALAARSCSTGSTASLAQQQVANHGYMVQAMLSTTVV